jgi:hypothetical protein
MFRQLRLYNQMHIWLCACAHIYLCLYALFFCMWHTTGLVPSLMQLCVHTCCCMGTSSFVCAYLALFLCIETCLCTSGGCVHIWPSVCTSGGVCSHLALGVHIWLSMIVICDVLMKMAVNTTVFWVGTQCNLDDVCRRFK